MFQPIKRKFGETSNSGNDSSAGNGEAETSFCDDKEAVANPRVLRSRYLAFKTRISGESGDMAKADSNNFKSIFNQIESLHQLVQRPREQVADAEALLGITNTLVASVRAQNKEGITVPEFVSSLLRNFGGWSGGSSRAAGAERNSIVWRDVGLAVSHTLRSCSGYSTMSGPMDKELKRRKVTKRTYSRPTEKAQSQELDRSDAQEATDTDEIMLTMFNILRKNKRVRIENLVLNRNSFAQTVENLFSLSFLVKDGRAEIQVDDNDGRHFVSPRNAPAAAQVASGEAAYRHFVFRFDFRDWKLMTSSVKLGEELMRQRNLGSGPKQTRDESCTRRNKRHKHGNTFQEADR